MIRTACLLAPVALAIAAPAQAEPLQLPLFDGSLVLQGDFGILADRRDNTTAAVEVWRPVLFGTPERPIGGRMDCALRGARVPFTSAMFDLEERYEADRELRERRGDRDEDPEFVEAPGIRRMEISGRANNPHRHYVLTRIALVDGDAMFDLKLDCTFRHLHAPPDEGGYAALMHQYIDIAVPVDPVATPQATAE